MRRLMPERLRVQVCKRFHPFLPLSLFPWQGPFVIVYHDVRSEAGPYLEQQAVCIDPRNFAAQIAFVAQHYRPIRFSDLRAHRDDPRAVAVTFDDGFRSNLTEVLPVIERHRCPIKIFLTSTNVLGELNWLCKLSYLWQTLEGRELRALADRALRPKSPGAADLSTNDFARRFDPARTPAAIDELFAARAGPPSERIYLDADEVATLAEHPLVELGSHSRSHYPLDALSDDMVREEVVGGHQDLVSAFGPVIEDHALPFGRREDLTEAAAEAVRSIGSPLISGYGGRYDERQVHGVEEIRRRTARGNVGVLYGRLRSIPPPA